MGSAFSCTEEQPTPSFDVGGSIRPPSDPYEIPPDLAERHHAAFLRYSPDEMYARALTNLQLILLIDHSGSMRVPDQDGTGRPTARNWRRWDNVIQLSWYLANTMLRYDVDGEVPVYMFGNNTSRHITHNRDEFFSVLQTHTPTTETTNLLDALRLAFDDHLAKPDHMLFVIITDGQPNQGQEKAIKKLIKHRLRAVDSAGERIGLLFIRIGDDPGAIRFLQMLDDAKSIGHWVDTKSDNAIYQMGPENVITNAIYEHLDSYFKD